MVLESGISGTTNRTASAVAILSVVMTAGGASAAGKPNTVPKDTCTDRRPPPVEMAAWSSPEEMAAARSEAGLAMSTLTPGKAITAKLLPVGDVKYRMPPGKADGPATFGGLYALTVNSGGTYRIASSAAPWMDVFVGNTPVKAGKFGHGPACTGIGKMVEFELQPGTYLVQFSESLQATTEILVVRTTYYAPSR